MFKKLLFFLFCFFSLSCATVNTPLMVEKSFSTDYCNDANCQACYLFKEGSGTTVDDRSSHSNIGSFKGTNEPLWSTDTPNAGILNSVIFDGSNDIITCGANSTLMANTAAISIVAWIKPNTVGQNNSGRIVAKTNSSQKAAMLFTVANNTFEFQVGGVTDMTVKATDNAITMGSWQHVAVTWDGSTTATNVHLYINGTEVSYQTQTNGVSLADLTGQTTSIGNRYTSQIRTFDGAITQIGVFNRVLSQAEIQDIYANGLGNGTDPTPPTPNTWYIRTDGGSTTECTGLTDAAYPGSGVGQDCALKSINYLLPPKCYSCSWSAVMSGGDTVIIDGVDHTTGLQAQYQVGWGAPGNPGGGYGCSQNSGCSLAPIPSGTDAAHPTRILGKNYNLATTYQGYQQPQIWSSDGRYGTGNASHIFALYSKSNIEIQNIEFTDHAACNGGSGTPYACNDTMDWGPRAIKASDSSSVLIKNVNIHGFARGGILAGRLTDWTLENVAITANGWTGWDGDIDGTDSCSGTLSFTNVNITRAGCTEDYPTASTILECSDKNATDVYADGLGIGTSGGNWIFDKCYVAFNGEDGLDLLYHDATGVVKITNSTIMGNGGNQVKIAPATSILMNNKIVGNCDYFVGKSYTTAGFDHCRADGNPLNIYSHGNGTMAYLYGNTIMGGGRNMIVAGGTACNGTEVVYSRNNIWYGGYNYIETNPSSTHWFYRTGNDGNGGGPCGAVGTRWQFNDDYSVVYKTTESGTDFDGRYNTAHSSYTDPFFAGGAYSYYRQSDYNIALTQTSPAIAFATPSPTPSIPSPYTLLTTDMNNVARGALWDAGALEFQSEGGQITVGGGSESAGADIHWFWVDENTLKRFHDENIRNKLRRTIK